MSEPSEAPADVERADGRQIRQNFEAFEYAFEQGFRAGFAASAAERERLRGAIERALADSESGTGWGPDVTVCAYLRAALGESP